MNDHLVSPLLLDDSVVTIQLIDFHQKESNAFYQQQQLLTVKFQLQIKGFVKWYENREAYQFHIRNWKSTHHNRGHLFIPIEFMENREMVLSVVEKDTSVYREYLNLIPSWKNDKEIVLKACQHGGFAFTFASNELKCDQDVALSAVKQNGLMISEIPLKLRNDRRIALMAVKQIGIALSHLPITLQSDEEIVLEATRQMTLAFRYASDSLKKDISFIRKAVMVNGMILEYLNEEFKSEYEIVKLAIHQNGLCLRFVMDFNDNEELVTIAVSNNGLSLNYASDRLKSNPDIVKLSINQNSCAIKFASQELLENHPEIQQLANTMNKIQSLKLVLQSCDESNVPVIPYYRDLQNLKFITGQLKGEIEFALKVLKQDNKTFQHFSIKLKENKEFILKSIEQEQHPDQILQLFSQLPDSMKSDSDILCESIKRNPSVISQAPEHVFSNRDFIHTLLKLNGFSLCYLKPFVKNSDKELILSAIRQNGLSLMFCPNRWKFNVEAITEAVQQNGFIIPHPPHQEENHIYKILFGEQFLKELKQIRMNSCYKNCYIPDRYWNDKVC